MSREYRPDPGETVKVLAARLDRMERDQAETRTDVQALGRGVADLTTAVRSGTTTGSSATSSTDGEEDEPQPDWFDPELTVKNAHQLITALIRAKDRVLAHYGIGLVPVCWPLHPTVVADVLALTCEREAAYADPRPTRVSEWVNRWQPAATDRITTALNQCRQDRAHHDPAGGMWNVGDLDPYSVAAWWATDRATPAPTAFGFTPA